MRFTLLEKVPSISADEIKRWNSASDKVRGQMATDILNRYENSYAMNLWHPFRKSLKLFGIDPKDNPFIEFTDRLVSEVPIKKTDDKLYDVLVDMHQRRLVDLNHSYLTDPQLYKRSSEEFQYTVNVFETVLDPSRINKYFNDTSKISVDQLYDNGIIKPAGNESTADNTDTIFGTVESWSGTNSENDKPPERTTSSEHEIGPREQKRIQKQYTFTSLKDIENPEIGMRVFITTGDTPAVTGKTFFKDTDAMTPEKGFWEFTKSGWQRLKAVDK